jgi:hypothetical protein
MKHKFNTQKAKYPETMTYQSQQLFKKKIPWTLEAGWT